MISCSKATAWKWFSLYIRLRDASLDGYVRCCTCSSIKHFKQIQAGHYYSQGAYRRLIFESEEHFKKNKEAEELQEDIENLEKKGW